MDALACPSCLFVLFQIDELLRQHQVKKDELNELLSTSEQDMWRKDLQTLLEGVDDVDNMERLVMSHTPSAKGKGRHGKKVCVCIYR